MIINKFPYQKISRKSINGVRLYACPNGDKLPSVTTILDITKTQEKKQVLENWRKRVGHANAAEITKQAAGRGTKIHTFLENYMKNDQIDQPDSHPQSIESYKMANQIIRCGLKHVTEYYGSEVSLYYPELYAGTTDCVALYKGELAVIDFKQTNRPKKSEWVDDYRLQLCAYISSHNILYNTEISRGIVMMCSGQLDYQQFEITPDIIEKYTNMWWERVYQYYDKSLGG